jgi:hypothetical protein
MEEVKIRLTPGAILSHFRWNPWVLVWDILWFVSAYPIVRAPSQL